MVAYDIELKKINQAKEKFKQLSQRVKDFRPIFNDFIDFYQKEIVPSAFETKGALMGKKWQGLTERYRRWKANSPINQSGSAGVNLRLTNGLYNAATGGDGWYQKVKKRSLQFGIKHSVIPYANRHQKGTKGMPERPFFYTINDDMPIKAWQYLIKRIESHLGIE